MSTNNYTKQLFGLKATWRWHRHLWLTLLSGILLGAQVGHSQINTFPHTESFENGGALPAGWTTQNVNGSGVWQMVTANGNFSIIPRTGTYMAEFRTAASFDMAMLISPSFDLTSLNNPQLSFYYANVSWFGDIDDMQVYYSEDDGENWTPLGDLIDQEHTSWTEAVYSLPSPSSTYKIAFESMSFWARGFNIDDVMISETPTCPTPVSLTATSGLEYIDLEWIEVGDATEWEIEYGAVSFAPTGIPNVVGIFSESHHLDGLTQGAMYDVYLRSKCAEDDLSFWVGPFTVNTLPCIPTYTTGKADGDLLSRVRILGTTLDNNSGIAQVNPAYTFFTGQPNYTATLLAGSSYTIEVSIGTWGNQGVAVWIDFNGDGVFDTPSERVGYTSGTIGSGSGGTPIPANHTASFTISLPCDPIPGTYRMRVRDAYGINGVTMDPCMNYGFGETEDYVVTVAPPPPCPSPTNAQVLEFNAFDATFDWNAGCSETLWDVHVTTVGGGAPAGAPSDSGVIKPFNKTGLAAGTNYEYWVRAECDENGSSEWLGPITFTTLVVAPLPYDIDFATVPNDWTIDLLLPGTWFQGTPLSWPANDLVAYTNVWSSAASSALMSVNMGPVTAGMEASFDYAFSDYGSTYTSATTGTGSLTVLISTDFGATYTSLGEIPVPGAGWHHATYDLTDYEGHYVQLRFLATRTTGDFNIAVDNLYVGIPPTCFKPTELSASAVTTTSALISWETPEDGAPVDYQYVFSTSNGLPAGAGTSTGGATSALIGSLLDEQTYYLYVRTDCGDGDYSTWAGPISHTAGYCIPQYSDDPEEGTSDGDVISNVVIAGTALSNNSGTASGTPTYVSYPATGSTTAILNAGTSYNISITNGSYEFGGQNVAVWIDFNNDGVFETPSERVGYSSSAYTSGFQTINFPISLPCDPTPGDYRMRVRMVYGGAGSTIDPCAFAYYGEAEDYTVTVAPPPPCPAPSAGVASAITYSSASLSWTAGCTETSWDVHFTTAGGGAPAGTPSNVNATDPLVLSVLPLTNYEFWVRANCEGDGYSAWSGPFTFNTPAAPPVNDNCAGAVALTISQPYNGTTIGATQSISAGTCGGTADDDVWFSFVAPAYPINIFATGLDGVLELRSGSCNGTLIDCIDQIGYSDLLSDMSLTEGQTYLVRYYSYFSGVAYTGPYTIVVAPSSVPAPANDEPSATVPNIFNSLNTYPNCVEIQGTTAGATPSAFEGYNDVWYRFTAQTTGVSIRLESATMDGYLAIVSADFELLDEEDAIWEAGGTEILNYGDLIPGNQYYLMVANYGDDGALNGPFSICLQHLKRPSCSSTSTTLCNYYISSNHTSYSNTFNFTDSNSELHSYTTTNYQVQLSHPSLGLRYNETYSVNLTSNYRLEDGFGDIEVIQVSGLSTCSVTIADHNPVVVKANQRCTTGAQLARTSVLSNQVASGSAICGATGYRVEFTPVANCSGDSPNEAGKFERTISAPNTSINMSYAFNHLPEASNPNLGYWSVRWRPRFAGYEGTYGPAYVIAVKKTAGAVAMDLEGNEEPVAGLSNMGEISANVYPNPNNGELVNLNITGLTGTDVYVRIMDSMGREVYTNRYTAEGSLNTIVNFSQPLAQGLYMVEFRDGDRVVTQRMMVSK